MYDLIALGVGQRGIGQTGWSNLLFGYSFGAAGIVTAKNLVR